MLSALSSSLSADTGTRIGGAAPTRGAISANPCWSWTQAPSECSKRAACHEQGTSCLKGLLSRSMRDGKRGSETRTRSVCGTSAPFSNALGRRSLQRLTCRDVYMRDRARKAMGAPQERRFFRTPLDSLVLPQVIRGVTGDFCAHEFEGRGGRQINTATKMCDV
jgi:hypothetical protein